MKYKVIGSRSVDGVEPGGEVNLDPVRGAQLEQGGHVALVAAKDEPAKKRGSDAGKSGTKAEST